MKKSQVKLLIKAIESALNESNDMFADKTKSHAFIVGYLEGNLKSIKNELSNSLNKK